MSVTEDLFEFDDDDLSNPTEIKVVGVGGGGNNAIDRMKQLGVRGVEFIAVNTDTQDLENTECDRTLQIGEQITDGLGSGADPKIGLRSAQDSRDKIEDAIEDADLLILTAGMGGGTGTGATPVIAEIAREQDILTIGIVTRPFDFEKQRRAERADKGIKSLRQNVDTLIVVPNQRIYDVIGEEDIALTDAFERVDEVLFHGVQGISEVIMEDGYINLDFADVRTVLANQGDALLGIGEAAGENAPEEAARRALDCPLLETNEIDGARGVLINIAGSDRLTAKAVQRISDIVNEKADDQAEVLVGTALRRDMEDAIRVTTIAAGFPERASDTRGNQARSADRDNVIDVQNIHENKDLDRPAYERKEEGGPVEVVDSNPEEVEEEEPPDEEENLNIPTFMRVN
ncbi:MAG: cell division protein FtsZ [bacterium]